MYFTTDDLESHKIQCVFALDISLDGAQMEYHPFLVA